mmetsp:Transcript_44933/g.70431  ORF Transcript_44933/g.70431 Transcript_44933/m.70431 type:complete len:454 (+) Transcript_44933:37-1398(+)
MKLTDTDINFLILKYLRESGYIHSSFSFLREINIGQDANKSNHIPPGLLVSLIQRGLFYAQIESQVRKNVEYRIRSPIENYLIEKFSKDEMSNFKLASKNKMYRIFFKNSGYFGYLLLWNSRFPFIYTFNGKNDMLSIEMKFEKLCLKGFPGALKKIFSSNSKKKLCSKITCLDSNLFSTLLCAGTEMGNYFIISETLLVLKSKFISSGPISKVIWSENSRWLFLLSNKEKLSIVSTWNGKTVFELFPFFTKVLEIKLIGEYSLVIRSEKGWISKIKIKQKVFETVKMSQKKLLSLSISEKYSFLIGHIGELGFARLEINKFKKFPVFFQYYEKFYLLKQFNPISIGKNILKGQNILIIYKKNMILKSLTIARFKWALESLTIESKILPLWSPESLLVLKSCGNLIQFFNIDKKNSFFIENPILTEYSLIKFSPTSQLFAIRDNHGHLDIIFP